MGAAVVVGAMVVGGTVGATVVGGTVVGGNVVGAGGSVAGGRVDTGAVTAVRETVRRSVVETRVRPEVAENVTEARPFFARDEMTSVAVPSGAAALSVDPESLTATVEGFDTESLAVGTAAPRTPLNLKLTVRVAPGGTTV